MTVYGYARVSTDGQTLASQDAQLHAAGCAKVYGEKVSGTKTDRAELARVLKRLETGDVLMVTRLDRLARSTRDLLNILHTLGERGVGFKSLADSWADTTTPHGRLLVTMLAGIAEFERELIRARTGEGRTRAKARGVRFGRPPVLSVQHELGRYSSEMIFFFDNRIEQLIALAARHAIPVLYGYREAGQFLISEDMI